jgi:Poxvirus A32 protein
MPADFIVKPITDIKKKKYPKHRYENIPSHPTCAIFCGTRNSGKSTVIYNLITDAYKGYFHRIVLMTPNINMDELYQALCDEDKLDTSDCYPSFDDKILQQIMDDQDAKKDEIDAIIAENADLQKEERQKVPGLPRVLIVIDDSAAEMGENVVLKKLFQIGRHKSITTFLVTQKYKQINTALRANCENLIITRLSTALETKSISEEKNIDILPQFLKEMNDKYPYNFAWINKFDKLSLGFTGKKYN